MPFSPPSPPPPPAGVGCLLSLLPSLTGQVAELSAATRTHLEELLLEGDLLEVSLDQTFLIHRVLQAASLPPRETLRTLIQVRRRNACRLCAGLKPPWDFEQHLCAPFPQIELEEQRRSSRGRSKDKRKRKSHRNDCGEKGAQRSPQASESKKTCPTSHSHSIHPPVALHPQVTSSSPRLW